MLNLRSQSPQERAEVASKILDAMGTAECILFLEARQNAEQPHRLVSDVYNDNDWPLPEPDWYWQRERIKDRWSIWHRGSGGSEFQVCWTAGPSVRDDVKSLEARRNAEPQLSFDKVSANRLELLLKKIELVEIERQAVNDRIKVIESEAVENLGGGEVTCHLCKANYSGPEEEGDEKGPWHSSRCVMYLKRFRHEG